MKIGHVSVITTISKGRTVVASKLLKAGTIVVLEDPIACVPFVQSSMPALCTTSGVHKLTKEENILQQGGNRSGSCDENGDSKFVGNLCILASRFYLYGATTYGGGSAGVKRRERYELIKNHVGGGGLRLVGLNECAIIVQRLINSALSSTASIPRCVTVDDCIEVICKLSCNLFTIVDDFQNEAGIGCYPYAALINHSCEPNCIQRFDAAANIVIRCVKDIQPGEELTISYADTGKPTWYRQRELLRTYHFHCQCTRCTAYDATDGYCCTAQRCSAGANSTASSVSNTSQLRNRATAGTNMYSVNSTCHATSSSEEHVFRSWLDGHSDSSTSSQSSTALPFPCTNLLPNVQVQCSVCLACRSGQEIAAIIGSINQAWDSSQNPNCQQYSDAVDAKRPPEVLHTEIMRCSAILEQMRRLVSEHHYCVLIVRKLLKECFEKHLPVRDGTLLFPALTVRAALATGVSNKPTMVSTGKSARPDEVVVMSALDLRALYEDNLQCILRSMPHCFSTKTPNLCHTYYHIQYVWFVLSKPQSLVGRGSNCAADSSGGTAADLQQVKELLAEFTSLLQVIKTVYGEDHVFYADMIGRQQDLAVMLSTS